MLPLGVIQEKMSKLDGWGLDVNSISKEFVFDGFKESLEFVDKVGEIAERREHHPMIVINFKSVRLVLSTHEEGGLTSKDFELAEEVDRLNVS